MIILKHNSDKLFIRTTITGFCDVMQFIVVSDVSEESDASIFRQINTQCSSEMLIPIFETTYDMTSMKTVVFKAMSVRISNHIGITVKM
jgi:hypothetical protein